VEYLNLAEFKDISIPNVPVPTGNRITVGVWVFIDSTANANKVVHIVIPDFMIISYKAFNNNVDVYCSMNQNTTSTALKIQDYTYNTNFPPTDSQYKTVKMTEVNAFWFYTRCAFNFDANLHYAMGEFKYGNPYGAQSKTPTQSGSFNYESIYTVNDTSTISINNFYRTFYRYSDKMTIQILNTGLLLENSVTFSLKNFDLYSEYYPTTWSPQR